MSPATAFFLSRTTFMLSCLSFFLAGLSTGRGSPYEACIMIVAAVAGLKLTAYFCLTLRQKEGS